MTHKTLFCPSVYIMAVLDPTRNSIESESEKSQKENTWEILDTRKYLHL
jgi:hypothetical protein